jgi:hypothetical protein
MRFALTLFILLCGASTAMSCPFCATVGLPFRERYKIADSVILAGLESTAQTAETATGTFRVIERLKGEQPILGQTIQTSYFDPKVTPQEFLLLGVEPPDFVWDLPAPLGPDSRSYLRAALALPENAPERLAFFFKHLASRDRYAASDAYDEFALAPYEDIQQTAQLMDRKLLRKWLENTAETTPRKQLFTMLLSVCGTPEDADWIETKMRSQDPKDREGLDATIACFLVLKGEPGLQVVQELYISDRSREFRDVFSALAALRFHTTSLSTIESIKIADLLVRLLDRKDVVEMVIADLARSEDWRHIGRLSDLFEQSYVTKEVSVRTPIINYLRSCSTPEAEKVLRQIEAKDPDAVRRAKVLIPNAGRPKRDR